MPLVSVIMPCYNAAKYLGKSIESLIAQRFQNWELIIVNDGSKDDSATIGLSYAATDSRIRLVSKENGGYVSARIFGYQRASKESKYLLFYDADDMLHPDMLQALTDEMETDATVGAAYCDHVFMDEHDRLQTTGIAMARFVPTKFWLRTLAEDEKRTPFISIFCWTKMIEPMTLIRRKAYEATAGWDPDFGLGAGNIGEGVFLFSEIALSWQVSYINRPLYYYRRHAAQMTAVPMNKMVAQAEIVIEKWKVKMKEENEWNSKVQAAILFFRYRLACYRRVTSFKHQIRYQPLKALLSAALFFKDYLLSAPLIFSYKKDQQLIH